MSVQAPDVQPANWPPPPPAPALICPKCGAEAACSPAVQTCSRCGRAFTLHAGPLIDRALAPPPPDPQAKRIRVRSAGFLLYHAGILEPESIQEGTLDPVIGRLPVNSTAILYKFVYSVAFWRSIDVVNAIENVLAWLVTLICLVGGTAEHGLLFFAVPFGLITAAWTYRIFGVRRWHVRVVGLKGMVVSVRFDKPWWNRRRFHAQLLQRCGMPPAPMP